MLAVLDLDPVLRSASLRGEAVSVFPKTGHLSARTASLSWAISGLGRRKGRALRGNPLVRHDHGLLGARRLDQMQHLNPITWKDCRKSETRRARELLHPG